MEMRAKYKELVGTGTYYDWVKQYLTDKGYVIQDNYDTAYTSDPKTWDALATSLEEDTEKIIFTYDGLMEYDVENELQPALAESYDVSDDGLTYTFHIRKGAKWVDQQGRELGEVTADDWVAAMQHMLDSMGGLEYLVEGVIKGASEYIDGTDTDFANVGVKAVDDYTLEYTLEQPTSYFTTMLGYSIFAPMNRAYYESLGGKFGAEYDSADNGTYGTSPENIAYCGPYLVSSMVANNSITFTANPSYWNPDRVQNKTITCKYNDGTDVTKSYNDTLSGEIDGASLNTSTMETAKQDGNFDKYAYVSNTEATTFFDSWNVNRYAFANYNDETKVVSPKDGLEANRAITALRNQNFRLALDFAVDRGSVNAQVTGEELKLNSLRNSYTPATFVKLAEDVTIKIGDEEKTYPAETVYGQIVQDQLDADGYPIKAYDPETPDGSDGYDGWYSVDNCKAYLDKAIEELKDEGVEISADAPIQIDYPCFSTNENYKNMGNAYKQSIEESTGGLVVVNLVSCETQDDWLAAGYTFDNGYGGNFDLCDVSGWGPDYGDPSTYLDTFLPDGAGYMTKMIGLF